MSSVDPVSQDDKTKAEDFKNKANEFFKGVYVCVYVYHLVWLWGTGTSDYYSCYYALH